MSQSIRQSELFAGNDWQVLYRAFTEVNFNASDPPSINRALRAYIQRNYPENFNDWIESSEFVALIDLLSWIAGTLAFKTDLNAREAFLETAESRESILRLARFISYNPRRNQASQGIVKIVEVATDDDVYDGFGVNLNGSTIKWDNPDDPDWFERFILVLNSAFISTNQFGVPLRTGTVGNAKTQLYRVNNLMAETNLGFSAKVSGRNMDFEIVNADFSDGGGFFERAPNYNNAFHLFYRNDGNGNGSTQTGFFMMFKQGTLQRSTVAVTVPVENNVIDIPATGVNDSDVWVQTVTDAGALLTEWSKVPAIFNENITYNNYDASVRNIFSVITRDEDAISIRFSDGRFGAVPVGNIRVWYRVSNGLQYQIRPADVQRVKLTIPYYNRRGVKKNLTLTFSLQETVSNSVPRETDEQVKARAPSVYATQNRMVSGEDYNTFPLQSNLAVKLKAINRVYSGHSRFIDLNDPTGNYQDVNVFSDDGAFFLENYNLYTEVPLSLNASPIGLISEYIQPMLQRSEVANFMREHLLTKQHQPVTPITWHRAVAEVAFASTGYVSADDDYLLVGSSLLIQEPNGAKKWATVASIVGDPTDAPPAGSSGPVTLSVIIQEGSQILKIVPPFNAGLSSLATGALATKLSENRSFTIWFDHTNPSDPWTVGDSGSVMGEPTVVGNKIKLMSIDYTSGNVWTISARGMRFVFESSRNVHWYNDGRRAQDSETGMDKQDIIRLSRINRDLNDPLGRGLPQDLDLAISRLYLNRDGSANPRRVTVTLADMNLNGAPDVPDLFNRITSPHQPDRYLFWQNTTNGLVPLANAVHIFDHESKRANATINTHPVGTLAFQIGSDVGARKNTFWKRVAATGPESGWQLQRTGTYTFGIGRGPNVGKSWVGDPQPKVPEYEPEWWAEVVAPVWVTQSGRIINQNEGQAIFTMVLATDPNQYPVSYFLTGNSSTLPLGMTLNPQNGTISGILPTGITTDTSYPFEVKATNGVLETRRQFEIFVNKTANAISNGGSSNGTVDVTPVWTSGGAPGTPADLGFVQYSNTMFGPMLFQATVEGNPFKATYSLITNAAQLPAGYVTSLPGQLTLSNSGVIQGVVPNDDTLKTYNFRLRAKYGTAFADRDFSLRVGPQNVPPPVWVTPAGDIINGNSFKSGTVFGPYQFVATVDGKFGLATYELFTTSVSDPQINGFPPGLTFGTDGRVTGTLGQVAQKTQYWFIIRARNGAQYLDRKFAITVEP